MLTGSWNCKLYIEGGLVGLKRAFRSAKGVILNLRFYDMGNRGTRVTRIIMAPIGTNYDANQKCVAGCWLVRALNVIGEMSNKVQFDTVG